MANLPGLDTSQVGVISFWNAISQGGAASIDPKEAAVKAWFDTYNEYDNGLEGVKSVAYEFGVVSFNVRIKDDGWIVVWFDRTNDYAKNQLEAVDRKRGYYDLMRDWTKFGSDVNTASPYLAYELNDLRSQLSNVGEMTFAWDDVGIYCYEFPLATTLTQAWERADVGARIEELVGGIKYTAGTTRYYHAAVAGVSVTTMYCYEKSRAGFTLPTNLVSSGEAFNPGHGSLDVIADNLMPDADTFYYDDVYGEHSCAPNLWNKLIAAHLMIWK